MNLGVVFVAEHEAPFSHAGIFKDPLAAVSASPRTPPPSQ